MLNAFGNIERVVESNFFSGKSPKLLHICATRSELPSYTVVSSQPVSERLKLSVMYKLESNSRKLMEFLYRTSKPWYLPKMVTQKKVRTCSDLDYLISLSPSNLSSSKESSNWIFFSCKSHISLHMCTTCSELPICVQNV